MNQAYKLHGNAGKAWNSKLNPVLVKRIRKLSYYMTQSNIAKTVGVSQTTVNCVLTGKTWTHVT